MILKYYTKMNRIFFRGRLAFSFLFFLLLPLTAYSWGRLSGRGLSRLIEIFLIILSYIVVIIIGLAVLYFILGLIKIIVAQSDEDRKNGRAIIFNGLIIIFVMVSVWSLVTVINRTFSIDRIGPGGPTSSTINIFR